MTHQSSILSACNEVNLACATGNHERAAHYLSIAINRYHYAKFCQAIEAVQNALKEEHDVQLSHNS